MEWVALALVALVLAGYGMYRLDRPGWKGTYARISRTVRANLEARHAKEITSVIEIKTNEIEAKAKEEWEADFKGETAPEPEKHRIIRTDWYQTPYGPWPQWHCACGVSDHVAVADNIEFAQNRARGAAADHVYSMNKAEKKMKETGGDFAF